MTAPGSMILPVNVNMNCCLKSIRYDLGLGVRFSAAF